MVNFEDLSKRIVLTEPFATFLLLSVSKQETFTGSAIELVINKDGEINLNYNLKELDKLETPLQLAEIKRQLYHLSLFHPLYRQGKSNKKAYDLACELIIQDLFEGKEINPKWQTLQTVNKKLNENSKVPVDIKRQESVFDYYNILERFSEDELPEPQNNQGWDNSLQHLEEQELRQLESNLMGMLREFTNSNPGDTPNSVKEWLKILTKPPKVNYKSYIKAIMTQAGLSQEFMYTRSKVNLRVSEFMGKKKKPSGRIVIYIDASGSMNDSLFNAALSEINHLKKQLEVEVIIHQFATIVLDGEIYPVDKSILNFTRKERGGTNFTPVCQHFDEQKFAKQCIVLTDGEASTEYIPKNPHNMLWVVINSNTNINLTHLPGKSITVSED
jgi:predicted metal-dependent peptidase